MGILRLCWQTRLKTQSQSFNLPLPMKTLSCLIKHNSKASSEGTGGVLRNKQVVKTFKNIAYLINKAFLLLPFYCKVLGDTCFLFSENYRSQSCFYSSPLSPDIRPPSAANSSDRWSASLCCSVFILIHKHPLHKLAIPGHRRQHYGVSKLEVIG